MLIWLLRRYRLSKNSWTNNQLEDIALRLIEQGEDKGIRLRLLGGVAIRLLCKDVITEHPRLDRLCADIDLAGLSENTKIIEEVISEEGLKPHKEFNFLNVSSRMLFSKDALKVDIILDEFRMNHRWPIHNRLLPDLKTLPLEDIIMTKLQIVQLNRKDLTDLLAMALKAEQGQLDLTYLTGLCTKSWGFTYTVVNNCETIMSQCSNVLGGYIELSTLKKLRAEIKNTKKGIGWKLRGLIGDRIRWYELAEEPLEGWQEVYE